MIMVKYLHNIYDRYAEVSVIIVGIISISLTLYFYAYRHRYAHYKYYWQGYLLIFVVTCISLLRIFYDIWSRGLFVFQAFLLMAGGILIIYGGKKKKGGEKLLRN